MQRLSLSGLLFILVVFTLLIIGIQMVNVSVDRAQENPCLTAQEYFKETYGEVVPCDEMEIVSDPPTKYGRVHHVTVKIDGEKVTLKVTLGLFKRVELVSQEELR